MTTEIGSQTLYEDARTGPEQQGELFIAERIELPIPEPVDIPTQFPPTLDKILNGQDTAEIADDWWAQKEDDSQPPPESKAAQEAKKRRLRPPTISTNRRELAAISLETAGMMAISAGFWQIAPWCGLIVMGLCLILMGVAISRGPGSQ